METSPKPVEVLPDAWLDHRRALWLPTPRALVVADLHWGYAASHRATGNLLPRWGDEQLAATLDALATDYAPAEWIWLGDVLHARAGAPAAEAYLARSPVPVRVILGNHDRGWTAAGTGVRELVRGRCFLHHGDAATAVPPDSIEIIGHHHPAFVWRDGAGARLKFPALVASPTRLILPALSPWAAGTDWSNKLASGEQLWAITTRRIVPLNPLSATALTSRP